MNVLAIVHMYPPFHNAGAEYMLHGLLRRLVRHGHSATVAIDGGGPPPKLRWQIEGVEVVHAPRPVALTAAADVVLTHLDRTPNAIALTRDTGKPLVLLIHNDRPVTFGYLASGAIRLAVCNSRWIEAKAPGTAKMVLYPPVAREDYETPGTGTAILLSNLWPQKGSETFWAAAEQLPERRFIGLQGGYGRQDVRSLGNVDVRENTPAVREVYAETGLVLMPSSYESFGRTALEAACSGIPTVAHPTPGLKEVLGAGGMFADRDRTEEWVAAIRSLDDPGVRAAAAAYHRERARFFEVEAEAQMDELETRMEAM